MDLKEPIEDHSKVKKQFKPPHTFVILFSIMILAAISTYFIPTGEYDRVTDDQGSTTIVEGTYQEISSSSTGFFDLFEAVFQGMINGASIIFFLFIVGGAFGVLQKTEALERLISTSLVKMEGKEIYIIPITMAFFALCAGTYGMIEGSIAFIFVLLPLLIKAGFDSITAAAIPLVGTAIGYTGSFLNPFNVGVAQTIAGVPLYSGMIFRIICWILFLSLGIWYTVRYAKKVQKDPTKSLMYVEDKNRDLDINQDHHLPITKRHISVLIMFGLVIVGMVVGVSIFGWYLKEMAALFLIMIIVIGFMSKLGVNQTAESFTQGCKDIAEGALAVGFAYAIVVLIQESNVMDTIIYALSSTVENLPSTVAAFGMFGVQSIMNFIVSSGSGQAALTMPIMAPLSDLVDVSRQTAVLAFQFGDGISNMFTPTAGWLIAGLAIAGVSWLKWVKFIIPLLITLYLLGAALVTIAHLFIWPA